MKTLGAIFPTITICSMLGTPCHAAKYFHNEKEITRVMAVITLTKDPAALITRVEELTLDPTTGNLKAKKQPRKAKTHESKIPN